MREIGSEFWDVPTCGQLNNIFPEGTVWFISGRSALSCIINYIKKKQPIHTVALPSWCCDSMVVPFIRAGIDILFYPVYMADGELKQDIREDCDAILVMDFFGYESRCEANKGIVIRDLTHGIFSNKHNDADYCFGSLRKWCGFWTGGFAWSKEAWKVELNETNSAYSTLREKAMVEKAEYISKKSNSKGYLTMFSEAEEMLENYGGSAAADRDIELAKKLDVKSIMNRRRENAQILLNSLSEYAVFPYLKENDCPLFVPIIVKNRDKLKRHLIENEIYCPVHWPLSEFRVLEDKTKHMYDEELSLICDQRYGTDDMERIIELVKMGVKEC